MPLEGQAPKLKALSDSLNLEAHGETITQANQAGYCIQCKLPALARCYSDAGRREYYLSGMCEQCFDDLFKEEED